MTVLYVEPFEVQVLVLMLTVRQRKPLGDKMRWHELLARMLHSKHSDTQAVVRAGKKGAKKRSARLARRKAKDELKYE